MNGAATRRSRHPDSFHVSVPGANHRIAGWAGPATTRYPMTGVRLTAARQESRSAFTAASFFLRAEIQKPGDRHERRTGSEYRTGRVPFGERSGDRFFRMS
jgi:hypothetical protein